MLFHKLKIAYGISKLEFYDFRIKLYKALMLLFFILSITVIIGKTVIFEDDFNFILADAVGYYVYLPSLIIDGDLDFSNQIKEHSGINDITHLDKILCDKTELGYVRNKYPIGFALTLIPSFVGAHSISLIINKITQFSIFEANGYSYVYQLINLAFILVLGYFSMLLIDKILNNYYKLDPKAIFAGVTTYWIGSNYAYYYFRVPFMIHVVSNFWVVVTVYLIIILLSQLNKKNISWPLLCALSFSLSMSIVCRPTNLFIAPFFFYLIYKAIQSNMILRILKFFPIILLGFIPILVQIIIWHITTGNFIYYSYENEGFNWTNPMLLQTLFSSRHGLFFWSPLLLGSVAGIILRISKFGIKHDPILICYILSFFILWYFNSAWHSWWFGDSFGGRAFLELTSLFIIGLAFLFDKIKYITRSMRYIVISCIALAISFNYVLMILYISHKIPRSYYL